MTFEERVLALRIVRDKKEFLEHFDQHPQEVALLTALVLDLAPYPSKEYSSWMLIHLSKAHPNRFDYLYPELVDLCFRTDDQTVLRNVLNTIIQLKKSKHREAEFIDLLLGFIANPKNKVALQVYSIYILIEFGKRYPELIAEFRQTIDFNARNKTAAYTIARRNFNLNFRE